MDQAERPMQKVAIQTWSKESGGVLGKSLLGLTNGDKIFICQKRDGEIQSSPKRTRAAER